VHKWLYRRVTVSCRCPRTSPISSRLAPPRASVDAASCLRSWNRKFLIPAAFKARCHAEELSNAWSGRRLLANTNCVGAPRKRRSSSTTAGTSGSVLRSPFFVRATAASARSRSTSAHVSACSSPGAHRLSVLSARASRAWPTSTHGRPQAAARARRR
jgi:hypothetical protein